MKERVLDGDTDEKAGEEVQAGEEVLLRDEEMIVIRRYDRHFRPDSSVPEIVLSTDFYKNESAI